MQGIEIGKFYVPLRGSIINGVKVLFEQDRHGFWDADIRNSLVGDLFFDDEGLVRGRVDFSRALDIARGAIPLIRLGYIATHSDPEGRICFFSANKQEIAEELIETERGEAWKGNPVPQPGFLSNRLSRRNPEDQAQIRAAIAEAEAEFDWSSATRIDGYSEAEVLAMLAKYKP
jgi:hypothetical protein